MEQVITAVYSIASAAGWYFSDDEPVICFALVSLMHSYEDYQVFCNLDKEQQDTLSTREIVPIGELELGLNLVGHIIDSSRAIEYKVQPSE